MIRKKRFAILFIVSLMILFGVSAVKSAPPYNPEDHIQIVKCSDNQHTYALYLPQSYSTTGNRFRVLFCFDAEGHGDYAVKQFMYARSKISMDISGFPGR
jgi:hypothetical protein